MKCFLKNNFYLQKLIKEEKVSLKKFHDEVLKALHQSNQEVLAQIAQSSPQAQKIVEDFNQFKSQILEWSKVSEEAILPYLKM